jgi:hypothetical protein
VKIGCSDSGHVAGSKQNLTESSKEDWDQKGLFFNNDDNFLEGNFNISY